MRRRGIGENAENNGTSLRLHDISQVWDRPTHGAPRVSVPSVCSLAKNCLVFLVLLCLLVFGVKLNEAKEGNCFGPDSLHQELTESKVIRIDDETPLEGQTPKFKLHLLSKKGNEFEVLFKPALNGIGPHLEVAWNELIAFHLDCLLGIGKTPPVFSTRVMLSESDVEIFRPETIKMMEDRGGLEWSEGKSVTLVGIAQLWVSGIQKRSTSVSLFTDTFEKICILVDRALPSGVFSNLCGDSNSLRIINERRMFDFIQGNWDRPNNHFYMEKMIEDSEGERNKEKALVYIDHNHVHQYSSMPFYLHQNILTCRQRKSDIEKLKNLGDTIAEEMEKSLRRDVVFMKGAQDYRDITFGVGRGEAFPKMTLNKILQKREADETNTIAREATATKNAATPTILTTSDDFFDIFLGKYKPRRTLYEDHIQKCILKYGEEFVMTE